MFADLFGASDARTVMNTAACCELLHTVSLIHDDVIDDAKTRKGRRAANTVWGNRSAVIMGDHFFVLAYTLLIKQRDFRVLDLYVDTCRALAEGIMMEIGNVRNIDVSIESHLDIISHKTAGFFKTAALVGGHIAGANVEQEKHLEQFGLNFGLAFQLSDDMLDLFAESKATGKHRGADLMGGIYTVPVIHALNESGEFKNRFLPSLIEDSLTPEKIDEIALYLRNNGAFDFSLGLVKHYGKKALEHLAELSEGKANDSFRILTEKIIEREY
ncbi:MAG: polyprenyl synthetase family protein, partial [bacterium]